MKNRVLGFASFFTKVANWKWKKMMEMAVREMKRKEVFKLNNLLDNNLTLDFSSHFFYCSDIHIHLSVLSSLF